nr:PAS domain-containing protein [Methanospirillum sp. J.3.6.1-F.2.7.3]
MSEQKYRELVENANCMIVKLDTSGNIIFFNEFAQHFLGFKDIKINEKIILSTIYSNTDSNERNISDFVKNLLHNPEKYDNNLSEIIKKDGVRCWIAWTNKLLLDSQGKITGILSIGHDITDQKIVEEKLLAIINFLPDATFVIDIEGKVIAWNYAIEEITGVKAENIIGMGNYEYSLALYNKREPIFIDYALRPDLDISNRYTNYKQEGNSIIGETYNTFLNPNGIYLWGKASSLFDANGNIIGAIESFRDITHLKNEKP